VIFVKDLLYAILALISAVIAVFSFLSYQKNGNVSSMMLIVAILFLLLTVGFGAMFLSGRVNKNDDIHITE
jgi:multisubunit Na+/H+ antiporter MnhG subunit